MLLLGTDRHLEDLDRQFSIGVDVSVTGIAAAWRTAGPGAWVLLDGARIARVTEYGLEPVAALPTHDGQSIAGTGPPAAGGLLVGLRAAHLCVVDPESGEVRALDAFDAVDGRDTWENPAGPSPDLRSLAVTPAGAWTVNVHVGGVWRSTDEGRTWTNVVPPESDVHEVVAGEGGRVAAAAAIGFGWSTDDGQSWRWTTEGLHAPYCRAVALDGDLAFVTASTGPGTRDGRLYRGELGGAFEPCELGVPGPLPFNLDTGCLTARGGGVAVGAPDGRVWRSGDRGESFETVTERVGRVQALRFV